MAINVKKRVFLLIFCLASVVQGMYSTYFVSILTTIERIYQIQSKTVGAIMSATEFGQILGSLLIAYYGGKGNKPKWMAACMTLMAIAALISTSPHFLSKTQTADSLLLSPYINSYLNTESQSLLRSASNAHKIFPPTQDQLCYLNSAEPSLNQSFANNIPLPSTHNNSPYKREPMGFVLVIFTLCLLTIGFGSTAITTLGIPFIDDIVSKEESPMYLGLTIALKILGPALGFLLGSFCIRLDVNLITLGDSSSETSEIPLRLLANPDTTGVGAWWLGLIIISSILLTLAIPMYFLSRLSAYQETCDEFKDITYQAAEDHDIGGSRDFQPHVLAIGDLDVTSNRTCYSEIDFSTKDMLQSKPLQLNYNFSKNITLDQPIITKECILNESKDESDTWRGNCVVVNHFNSIESTSFTNDESKSLHSSYTASSSKRSTMNLSSSLSRLLSNKLLILRMFSGILHLLPVAGFYTFFPKYLTEQFSVARSSASAISGLAGILFVGLGAFIGGTIVSALNVNSRLMAKWIASSALFYVIGMLILMQLGCLHSQTVYHESISNESISSIRCSSECNCSSNVYNPVCVNGTTYMSACLAGCKSHSIADDKIIYNQCDCSAGGRPTLDEAPIATQGSCASNCDNLKWYIIIFSVFTFIHSTCEVGSVMFNLRCVKQGDRTLAFGLITLSNSLLGTIPCSVIYGAVIDLTCVYWNTLANQDGDRATSSQGACQAYDNDKFRYYLHGITALVMFLAFLVDCIIIRCANVVDFYENNDSKEEATVGDYKKSTETI